MNNSEKEGSTSVPALHDPPVVSEPPNTTGFERWRQRAWRAAGFGLSDDEKLESVTRSCEQQKHYLMNYSAYNDLSYIPTNAPTRSNCCIHAKTPEIIRM